MDISEMLANWKVISRWSSKDTRDAKVLAFSESDICYEALPAIGEIREEIENAVQVICDFDTALAPPEFRIAVVQQRHRARQINELAISDSIKRNPGEVILLLIGRDLRWMIRCLEWCLHDYSIWHEAAKPMEYPEFSHEIKTREAVLPGSFSSQDQLKGLHRIGGAFSGGISS